MFTTTPTTTTTRDRGDRLAPWNGPNEWYPFEEKYSKRVPCILITARPWPLTFSSLRVDKHAELLTRISTTSLAVHHRTCAQHKVAVLTYKLLHGSAPRYLGPLVAVADLPGWRALRAASTSQSSRATHQTVYCWQLCIYGCRSPSLEQPTRRRRLIVITADFPSSFKNSSFSTVIPSPDSWLLGWHRYNGPCSNVSLFRPL